MNTLDNSQLTHHKLLRLATVASVSTAVILIIAKLSAWFFTGSLSLLATLLDSTMDAFASFVTFIAVKIAITPADENHHFGHGKAQQLAVLAQSAFITGSAVVLLLNASGRIFDPPSLSGNEKVGIAVMVISMLATSILLMIQRYVINQTQSAAITADALHYRADLLTNFAVIVALIGAKFGYYQLDNGLAIIISAYMLFSVRKITWSAIQELMDHSLPEAQQQLIEEKTLAVAGVQGIHELRTRISGSTPFIQMHIDLKSTLTLQEAHEIGFNVKQRILESLPDADIIIHLDPT